MKLHQKSVDIGKKTAVLTKSLLNLTDRLNLNQREIGAIIGLSETSASRFFNGSKTINPESKEGELALLLIRVFRSLDAILGGDQGNSRLWFKSYNKHLNGIPAQLITKVEGLTYVANYLDVMRGKL